MSESKPRKTDVQKLQRAIVDGLEDVKGQDIVVFNTEHLSPLFERVIIASGTSNRQTKALASSVSDAVREAGFPKPRVEGEDNGEWIIVDCGAAVAHVMQPTIRAYYHLEEIWGGKKVHVRGGAELKPAAEPAKAGKPGKKAATTAEKPTAKKAAATAAKPAGKVAKKAAEEVVVKKAAAKAPAKKASTATKASAVAKATKTTTAPRTLKAVKAAAQAVGLPDAPAKPARAKRAAGATGAATPKAVPTLVVGKPAKKTTKTAKAGSPAAAAKPATARRSPARKTAG